MEMRTAGAGDARSSSASPVSLVTGANRGIGLETCRQLAELGHVVVLTARSAASAADAADALGDDAGRIHAVRLDVADPESAAAAADEVRARFGRLDALINNAAIGYDPGERASSADLAAVRAALETNLLGAWQVTLAFLPLLRRSAAARIVNVSSEAGSVARIGGGSPAYTTSKVGLNALTKMLAAELRGSGILVNAVCPGWVATDMGGAGGRPVAAGAAGVVWAATLPEGGPTGGFYRDGRPLPW